MATHSNILAWRIGPSCSVTCQIFLDQGSNLCLLHWQEWILYHWDISRQTQGPFLWPCLALITSLKIFIYSHTRREVSVWIWGGVGDTIQSITKVLSLSVPLNLSFSLSTLEVHKYILFISIGFFFHISVLRDHRILLGSALAFTYLAVYASFHSHTMVRSVVSGLLKM